MASPSAPKILPVENCSNQSRNFRLLHRTAESVCAVVLVRPSHHSCRKNPSTSTGGCFREVESKPVVKTEPAVSSPAKCAKFKSKPATPSSSKRLGRRAQTKSPLMPGKKRLRRPMDISMKLKSKPVVKTEPVVSSTVKCAHRERIESRIDPSRGVLGCAHPRRLVGG